MFWQAASSKDFNPLTAYKLCSLFPRKHVTVGGAAHIGQSWVGGAAAGPVSACLSDCLTPLFQSRWWRQTFQLRVPGLPSGISEICIYFLIEILGAILGQKWSIPSEVSLSILSNVSHFPDWLRHLCEPHTCWSRYHPTGSPWCLSGFLYCPNCFLSVSKSGPLSNFFISLCGIWPQWEQSCAPFTHKPHYLRKPTCSWAK